MRTKIEQSRVIDAAKEVISMLPEFWQDIRLPQVSRVSEEISWIFTPGGTVVDLGGSSGFHTSICSLLGMKAYCVDNYKIRGSGHKDDDYWFENDIEAEKVAMKLNVEFIQCDLLKWDPSFADESIDVVMTFDNIEHLHHSPRNTYKKLIPKLKKGGIFIIGGPNAANLLKRFRVPLGKNIFSKMSEWYDYEMFIGHVREPVVDDYKYICDDLGLDMVEMLGRNWLGARHLERWYGSAADKILRHFPALCSDIYMLGVKP